MSTLRLPKRGKERKEEKCTMIRSKAFVSWPITLAVGCLGLQGTEARAADKMIEVIGNVVTVETWSNEVDRTWFGAPLVLGSPIRLRFLYPDGLENTTTDPNASEYVVPSGQGSVSMTFNEVERIWPNTLETGRYNIHIRDNAPTLHDRFDDTLLIQATATDGSENSVVLQLQLVDWTFGADRPRPDALTSTLIPPDGSMDLAPFDTGRHASAMIATLRESTVVTMYVWSVVVRDAPTPAELIQELAQTVVSINLEAGIGSSLDAKLDNAIAALDESRKGNSASAANLMHAFVSAVEAQRGKKLTDTQASKLVNSANRIIETLAE
jgi:hypothetical protein